MRRYVRVALFVLAVGCLFAFFSFGGGGESNGYRQTSRAYVGEPWPWFEMRLEQELTPNGGVASSSDSGIILKSPAWLLLATAVAALVAFRWLRPAGAEGTPA